MLDLLEFYFNISGLSSINDQLKFGMGNAL